MVICTVISWILVVFWCCLEKGLPGDIFYLRNVALNANCLNTTGLCFCMHIYLAA